jgi:hypothetical protein
MGVTIHYRGRIADLTRIEDFEDRLVDFALEIGGLARIWRTWPDDNPARMVRGVILDLSPGHESTSLLLSPEGWLIGLIEIEDAENGRLEEPPWCFVKTQFGAVEGHVALVEIFTALKREFMPDLEVSDEGGYWETRNLAELVRKRALIEGAIEGLAEALNRYGLSREAAEDPDILIHRIERVAALVHRNLRRPAEHPPVEFGDDNDSGVAADPEAVEKLWDDLSKHNRRQQERLLRAIEELRSRGVDHETAFRDALREVVPDRVDEENSDASDEPWRDDEHASFDESLEDVAAEEAGGFREDDDEQSESEAAERHPLLQRATDLFENLVTLFRDADPRLAASLGTLFQGVGEAMGGLAQALSDRDHDAEDYGLRVVQLKRALRGAALAWGALFPLRATLDADQIAELFRVLEQLATDITSELGKVRAERTGDES